MLFAKTMFETNSSMKNFATSELISSMATANLQYQTRKKVVCQPFCVLFSFISVRFIYVFQCKNITANNTSKILFLLPFLPMNSIWDISLITRITFDLSDNI